MEQYLLAKEKMKQLELEATKIRAKAQFTEEGERSTRYFYSLESTGFTEGNHNFYRSLYSTEPSEDTARRQFLNDEIPKLPDNDRESCEGIVTEQKLCKAVSCMENNKSPPRTHHELYKHFCPLIGEKLTCVYNYAYHTGRLSVSQRRGVISLLLKKGDRTQLKNWQPIKLLSTDYKILTKALANRLQRVLLSIIHTDQTASIKGRTINDNTRLLQDVIAYANENNLPLALISVDLLKAFDRVSHEFLFESLERFGFGANFLH